MEASILLWTIVVAAVAYRIGLRRGERNKPTPGVGLGRGAKPGPVPMADAGSVPLGVVLVGLMLLASPAMAVDSNFGERNAARMGALSNDRPGGLGFSNPFAPTPGEWARRQMPGRPSYNGSLARSIRDTFGGWGSSFMNGLSAAFGYHGVQSNGWADYGASDYASGFDPEGIGSGVTAW